MGPWGCGMSKLDKTVEMQFRDTELETEVVAYVTRKDSAPVNGIKPEWFSSGILANLVFIVQELKTPLSRTAVMRELKKRQLLGDDVKTYRAVLDEVFEVDVDSLKRKSVDVAIEDILEMSEARKILYGVKELATSFTSGKATLDDTKAELRTLGRPVSVDDSTVSGNYLDGYEERVEVVLARAEKYAAGEDIGVPTGIEHFDSLTGGLLPTEFGVIGGRPGIGKTVTLQSFLTSAWVRGKNCFFVTGEMSKLDLEFRMDAQLAGIMAKSFRHGALKDKDFKAWANMIKRERKSRANFLEIQSFSRGFTMEDVESAAERVQDKYKMPIDCVCIDYLNIISPKVQSKYKSSRSWDAQGDVIWEVKEFYADFNGGISGWTAGQLVDAALDADILSLGDLKYSRAISETAPIVVGLVATEDSELDHTMEMQILKLRNVKVPDEYIVLRPNLERMLIHEEIIGVKDLLLMDDVTTPKRTKKRGRKK